MAAVKARVPMLVQHSTTSDIRGLARSENVDLDREDFFLHGPVLRRAATAGRRCWLSQ